MGVPPWVATILYKGTYQEQPEFHVSLNGPWEMSNRSKKNKKKHFITIEQTEVGNVDFTTDNIYKQSYILHCTVDASFTQ